jgi:hypothetical protein
MKQFEHLALEFLDSLTLLRCGTRRWPAIPFGLTHPVASDSAEKAGLAAIDRFAHQHLHRTAGHFDPFTLELLSHLVRAVDFEVRVVDALDLDA